MIGYTLGGIPSLTKDDFSRRRKQFVEVIAEHKLDGTTLPKTIILADGRRYEVEIYRDPFSTELAGETEQVTVYPVCRAVEHSDDPEKAHLPPRKSDPTYLFECAQRWYVLMKTT